MGSVITKDQKIYKLHYNEVRGDVLRHPHRTNTSCWEDERILKGLTLDSNDRTHTFRGVD